MRITNTLKAVAVAAVLTAATPVLAATTFSTNFDSTNFGPGAGFTTLSSYEGWTGGANGIEVQYNNVAGAPFSGANFVELDTNANSSMSRMIDAGSYILRYWYSDRPNVPANSNGISVLLNGSSVFTSAGGAGGSNTNWSLQTFAFTAAAPTTLTFAALGRSDSLGGYIDSVSLSAVPEPMTWAMMITGFGMMGVALRNRRAAAKVTYA
ncbi:MAG: PEP-CTERM sorting domain-containing protein [Lysobacteraceae bacterium]|jgi:hypothetical protein|nr:MAG: PEP-CTERM sorting domain-containing protein [Xanthomonadaceae bacterium]